MKEKDIIDRAFAKAEKMLGTSGALYSSDLFGLPPELQVVVRVVSAQGVIDNGGFKYFFEADWPGQPPYEEFIRAYEAIGCQRAAADLRRVVESFPFLEPHLHGEDRNAFMEANYDDDAFEVRGWGDSLCGDKTIWSRLAEYCERNRRPLGL